MPNEDIEVQPEDEVIDPVEGEEEQPSESPPSGDEPGATEEATEEEESETQEESTSPEEPAPHEPRAVEGESPRELALRKELERQRAVNANMRRQQFSQFARPTERARPQRVNPDEVLSKYKPEDVQEVETLINAVGAKMGFVRQSDIAEQSYQTSSETMLQTFLDSHPEYKAENDPDNANWNRFREAYQMYRPPSDPKAYAKIFNSIHRDIFGIQSSEGLKKSNAQREKIRTASHGQGSRQTNGQQMVRREPGQQLDPSLKQHLKGDFSDIFE